MGDMLHVLEDGVCDTCTDYFVECANSESASEFDPSPSNTLHVRISINGIVFT